MRSSAIAECLALTLCLSVAAFAAEQTATVDADATVRFLLAHQKDNGAFGPSDQAHADIAWNYPAVHALTILGADIPRRDDCLKNGQWAAFRQADAHRTNLHWDLYQKVQLNRLLCPVGQPLRVLPDQRNRGEAIRVGQPWTLKYQDREGKYYGPYGLGVFYDLETLWYMVSALTGVDGTIENVATAKEYIEARQAPEGAFVDAYRVDGRPDAGEAHLIATSFAILTLHALQQPVPNADRCIAWIQSCETPAGGFRWHPSRSDASNQPDVWYTWAALHALRALRAQPLHADKCAEWLNGLQNPDGGFGDRPGWNSRLYSTYYAVESLQLLGGDARQGIRSKQVTRRVDDIPTGRYAIFQAHLKAPAEEKESPAAMVDAVHAMKLHLIGAKTADVRKARAHAAEKGYELEIIATPENYAHRLHWLGGHPADHVSNWLIPPNMSPKQQSVFQAADTAGRAGLPWTGFCQKVIRPTQQLGTLFYPEMDYSMMNAYMVYDDGLDGQAGFNAFIAALGWPAWDWVRHFPYRERWVGKLPAVADGDAHGDVTKWQDRLQKQRVLYLATDYRLDGFLDACRHRRTVCVIRDESAPGGAVFYGAPEAVGYVRQREAEWRWW